MSNCYVYNNCSRRDCDKETCLRREKLIYLFNRSMLSESQRYEFKLQPDSDGTDLDEFKKLNVIKNDIVNFVNSGKNLYIHSSNCGNGKSSWAIKLIQEYINKIAIRSPLTCRALFVSTPRFLMAMKDSISNKNEYYESVKDDVYSADLVVFDDIANKIGTDFELNSLLGIIDHRISAGKSTIFTSNMSTLKDLQNALGDRLASRISQYSENIEFHGSDKRGLGGNK